MPSLEAIAALDQLSIRSRRYLVEAFKTATTINDQFHARNVGKAIGISDAKSRELAEALTSLELLARTVYGDRQTWTPLGLEVAALLVDRRLTGKVDSVTLEALQSVALTPKEERLLLIILDRSKPQGAARVLPKNFETPEDFSVEETDAILTRLSHIGPFANGHRILTFNRTEIYLDPEAETLAQIVEDRRAADSVTVPLRDAPTDIRIPLQPPPKNIAIPLRPPKDVEYTSKIPKAIRDKMPDDQKAFYLGAFRMSADDNFDCSEINGLLRTTVSIQCQDAAVTSFVSLGLWQKASGNRMCFTPEGKRFARDLQRDQSERLASEATKEQGAEPRPKMNEDERRFYCAAYRRGVGDSFDWAEVAAGNFDLAEASKMVSRFRQLGLWRMDRINAVVFTLKGEQLARELDREEKEAAESKKAADANKAAPMAEAEKTLLVELWRKSKPFGSNRMVPRPIDTVSGFSRDGLDDAIMRLHGRGLIKITVHEVVLLPEAETRAKDLAKEAAQAVPQPLPPINHSIDAKRLLVVAWKQYGHDWFLCEEFATRIKVPVDTVRANMKGFVDQKIWRFDKGRVSFTPEGAEVAHRYGEEVGFTFPTETPNSGEDGGRDLVGYIIEEVTVADYNAARATSDSGRDISKADKRSVSDLVAERRAFENSGAKPIRLPSHEQLEREAAERAGEEEDVFQRLVAACYAMHTRPFLLADVARLANVDPQVSERFWLKIYNEGLIKLLPNGRGDTTGAGGASIAENIGRERMKKRKEVTVGPGWFAIHILPFWNMLKETIKSYPPNVFAFGLVGVLCAVVMYYRLLSPLWAVLGTVGVFAGMIFLFVFKGMTEAKKRSAEAMILIWSVIACVCAILFGGTAALILLLFKTVTK